MTARFSNLCTLTVLLALATALPSAVGAQEEERPGLFSEVVDVRVVNIEIVVTDRDGVQVRGLGSDDFRLEVDGEEVPIDYFSEIRGGRVLETTGSGGTDLPAVPALASGEEMGTSYLVFIDDYFTFKEDRDQALAGIEADLALLGPDDRMAVVAFDGRELEMLTSWTGSAVELERVFRGARERQTRGLQRLVELRQYEAGTRTRPIGPATRVDPETQAYILRLADQVDRLLDGAAATLRSFAMPPGRKVMMLVTGGWPYTPSEFATGDPTVRVELSLVEGEALYRQVSDTANLLGYTLYPVDASGMGTRWSEDPAAASQETFGSPELVSARRIERQNSTRFLARETGGRPLLFGSADHALGETVRDTRSFYWLGFSPQRAWDNEAHDVRVTTRNGDLEVRSRRNFLDSSRDTEVTMNVESALLFGSLPQAPRFEVALGDWRKAGFRKMELPLTVSIPLGDLTFVEVGGRFISELELRLAVRDEEFNRAEIPVIPIRLESDEAPRDDERWEYTVPLRLRRKRHHALVAIYDTASGRILTAGIEIEP